MAVTRLNVPGWLGAQYPLKVNDAPTISQVGKIVAIHAIDEEISDQAKFDRGYTHLPYLYENVVPASKRCYVLLSDVFPGSGHTDGQIRSAAQGMAGRLTPQSCIGDQFSEGGSNQVPYENYFPIAGKFYQYLCEELGISGAANHNFFHNYDTKLTNFSDFFKVFGGSAANPLHPYMVAALANEAGARKKAEVSGGVQVDNPFYTTGMHNWTNAFTMMLWANDGEVKHWLFNGLFQSQVTYAAKADAKTVIYTSPWAQSLSTPQNEHHKNFGWIHPRTGGYWRVPNWHIVPMQKMLQCGFFGCLLSEGVYMWEVGLKFSNNTANDRVDPYAPASTWVSQGGDAPNRLAYGEPYYPKYPRTGADAILLGVHWYSAIKHIVEGSTGIAYAPYTTNGVSVPIQPGDPRLFRRGFQNFGQDTILHHANAERGMALACSHAGQTAIVYINPYKVATEKENITVTFGGNTFALGELEGGILHVFIAS